MKKSKTRNNNLRRIELKEGSGNVFADLGLPDADQRLARSKLGFHVYQLLAERKLAQREIAALLGIRQPEVSHLMNGHFNRFTTDKLLDFLRRLDRKVTFQISPQRPGESDHEVHLGPRPAKQASLGERRGVRPAPSPGRLKARRTRG